MQSENIRKNYNTIRPLKTTSLADKFYGNGQGLSTTVIWPYDSTNILPLQYFSKFIGNKDVNINLEPTEEIVSGISSSFN